MPRAELLWPVHYLNIWHTCNVAELRKTAPANHRLQGRIKASAGPGAVPNAGPLQTYNQVTTPTNCGPPKLRAQVLQHP